MTKLNEYLRKVCAIALAMVMAMSPVASFSIAEGEGVVPAQVTQEPTTPTEEPTQEATQEPTAEPTQPPVQSEAPTATPVAEESEAPAEDPSASPAPDASTSPEASPEVTPEASQEPTEEELALLAGDMELLDITFSDAPVTLLGGGDTWQWSVTPDTGNTRTILYSVVEGSADYLSISTTGMVTTKTVTSAQTATIAAQYIGDDESRVTRDITILPAPTSVAFLDAYSKGINLTVNAAVGYSLKADDLDNPRYTLGFDSSVTADIEDYADLIRFSLANNRIPVNANTGVLTNQASDYTTLPVQDEVTISVRANGSKSIRSVSTITLRVSAVPSRITVSQTSATIPVGSTFKPTFTATTANGTPITLDDSAFELEITRGDAVELVDDELAVRGASIGIAEVVVKVAGLPEGEEVESDPITITVQDVPTDVDQLMLVDTDTNMTVWSGDEADTPLEMGLNQQISLQVKPINTRNSYYIGKVTASSSSVSRVGVSVNANNIITLSAKALTYQEEVTVSIRVNDGLARFVDIPLTVQVLNQPTEIRLSETEYSLCEGDSFTLVAIPLPENNSTTGYTYTVSDARVVSVERIQTPANGDSANGYFKVTALANAVATGATTATARVTITATGGNKPSAVSTITVGRTPISVGVEGSGTISIPVGQSYRLRPYLLGSDGTRFGGTFTFRSGTPSLVTVDENGVLEVTGEIDENTYPLGVTVQVSSAKWPTLNAATVYVKSVDPENVNFYFDDSSYVLSLGESITVTPSFSPTNSRADISFALTPSGSNLTMETTADGMGVVLTASSSTAALGDYQLTATAMGISTSCTIVVGRRPTRITVDAGYTRMVVGQTIRPTYTLTPSDAATSGVWYSIETFQPTDLTYTDSNGVVQQRFAGVAVTDDQTNSTQQGVPPASVSGNYTGTEIRAVSEGFVRVEMRTKASAHNAGVRVQWLIEIIQAPDRVEYIDKQDNVSLLSGMQFTQRAAAYTQGGIVVDCAITYTSSDTSIATVDSNGVVTAKRTGDSTASTVTITASAPGVNQVDFYTLHVYDSPSEIRLADSANSLELQEDNHYESFIGVNETIRIIPSFDGSVNITPDPIRYTTEGQGIVTATAVRDTATNTTTEGDIRGVRAGRTEVVTVSAPNGTYADVRFNVLSRPSKLTISSTALNIGLTETLDMNDLVSVWKNNTTLADSSVRSKLVFTCSNVQLAAVDPDTGVIEMRVSRNQDGTISQGDLNKVGQTFTVTASSVCSGVNSVSCRFTITNAPTGLLIDQETPYVRENITDTVTMLAGVADDTQEYKFVARFLPEGAAGFVDFFSGMSDLSMFTFTLDEDDSEYNAEATWYVRTEVDKSGNSVLYLRAVNNEAGEVTFEPTTVGGTLSTVLRVTATGTRADVDDVTFESPITLAVKDTYQIVPEYASSDVAADITYTSLNTSYLSVGSKTGLVTAKKAYAYPVNVRATWRNADGDTVSKTISFNVVSAPTAIYFRVFEPGSDDVAQDNLTSLNVYLGETEVYRFGYHFAPDNAMSSNVQLSIDSSANARYVTAELTPAADGTSGVITLSRVPTTLTPDGAILFTLTASGRTRSFRVYLRDNPESLSITPRTDLELDPGESMTFKGTATGSGSTTVGGTLYYTCSPAAGEGPVKSLNSNTGELVINDTVDENTEVTVTVHSTAVQDSELNMQYASATVNVLRSINAQDIADILYYKGTDDQYDPTKDTYCVGDAISLQCVYEGNEEFSRKYPVVFVTEDTQYVKVASSNNAATLTFLRQTTGPVTVYAVPSNLRYAPTLGMAMQFNVLPKATSVKWSFENATTETTIRKSGFVLNEQMEIDLTASVENGGYGMNITVLPVEAAPGVEVIGYSSNTSVATIEQEAVEGDEDNLHWVLKTPVGAKGTATITFSNSTMKLKDSFKVTVYALPQSIRLSPEAVAIGIGMSKTITASYVGGSSSAGISVAASDYVTVTPNVDGNVMKFTVTGTQATPNVAQLEVTTLAENSLAAAELNVRVYEGPTGIEINRVQCNTTEEGTPVLKVGETATITYTVSAANLDEMMTEISFSEEGEGGASVSWSGNKVLQRISNTDIVYSINVKALTPGTTTFTITAANGATVEQSFVIREAANSIMLNTPASPMLLPMWEADGEQPAAVTFTYSMMDKNGNVMDAPYVGVATLTNSHPNLINATLSADGTISVQPNRQGAKGTATIKLTAGGKSASLKVTVTNVTNSAKTRIKLAPSSITLVEGQSRKLSYSITNGIDTDVAFEIDDDSLQNIGLTIDANGYLTATVEDYESAKGKKWEGYVYATLTDNDLPSGSINSNRVKVTVKRGPETLEHTSIEQETIFLGVGESASYKYVKQAGESYTTSFTYKTSNRHAATVSTAGAIKGLLDGGTAIITMNSTNHTGSDGVSVNVSVRKAPTAISIVDSEVVSGTLNMAVGDDKDIVLHENLLLGLSGAVSAETSEQFGSYKLTCSGAKANKLVVTQTLDADGKKTFNIEALAKGTYNLTFKTFNNKSCKLKVVVTEE